MRGNFSHRLILLRCPPKAMRPSMQALVGMHVAECDWKKSKLHWFSHLPSFHHSIHERFNSVSGRVSSGNGSSLVVSSYPFLFQPRPQSRASFVPPSFLGKNREVYTREPQGHLTWPKVTSNLKLSAGDQYALTAKVIKGNIFSSQSVATLTDTIVPVAKLLSPLTHVSIFRCIGLNYAKHAEETNMPTPK
ncbi:hypothetical protein EDD21DRAFT_222891 [Dissophora ornata]|nr:hypothetical protein EDD21DRAFT_222891 [Dissophora ornata]